MIKNIINIGLPSKGRLKHDTINIFRKKKLNIYSERGENVKIGNFTEIKNSKIGNKSTIAHLSYIGDSILGKNINIGAGTITCNYDGKKKNITIIEDKVFIGSNTSLVAPLKIGRNSKTGAGSVITRNIPSNSLVVGHDKLVSANKTRKK